jgi:hypothetical protein
MLVVTICGSAFVQAVIEYHERKRRFLPSVIWRRFISQDGGNATLIIFGLKNTGRAPAGQEHEWGAKSEVAFQGREAFRKEGERLELRRQLSTLRRQWRST